MCPLPVNPVSSAARDAEVDEVGEVQLGDQDVRRLHITVDQACLMRGVQRCGDLFDDRHRARRLQRPVLEECLQIATLDEPHVDIEPSVDFAEPVDGDDVGFIQSRSDVCFTLKTLLEHRVRRQLRRKEFQRHFPIRQCVEGTENLAHAALAEHLQQPIAAEGGAISLHRHPFCTL